MTDPPDGPDDKAQTIAAFDAAEEFDAIPFWDTFGERTVARLALRPGDRVLDVCCGTGSSALVAARAVGPAGEVTGVDLAEGQLARGRARAEAAGLGNIRFVRDDIDDLAVDGPFDAVVCVFGIFFAADMAAAARGLRDRLRPGGRLAVTVWGPGPMEPAMTAFADEVMRLRPDWTPREPPWKPLASPEGLRRFLHDAGLSEVDAALEPHAHPIAPEDWWAIVKGSGLRAAVEPLDAAAQAELRLRMEEWLRANDVGAVNADVVYGTGTRMSGAANPR